MGKRKAAAAVKRTTRTGRELALRGDRVRALRLVKGWTQFDLAVKSGLAPRQVTDAETGKLDVRLAAFRDLAVALDCSADYLLGLSDSPR